MSRFAWLWLILAFSLELPTRTANAEENFTVVQTVRSNQLHLFAPVSVNNSKNMWFLVDTGSPKSLISPGVRQALELPSTGSEEATSMVGNQKLPIVFAQAVKAMDTDLGSGYFLETPIAFARERTREARIAFDKEGLLGMNFLLQHGAVINCRTQQIFFSRTGPRLSLRGEYYQRMGFTQIPIRITPTGYAEVEGTTAGSTYSFIIDTGSFWTILNPKIAEEEHIITFRRGMMSLPYGGERNVPFLMGRPNNLKLASLDLSGSTLGFSPTHTPNGIAHEWGGLIGADLLFKRHAIIDLGNRALYLMADSKRQ
jgi:hypothetical protein